MNQETFDRFRTSQQIAILVVEGVVPRYPNSSALKIVLALAMLGLAAGVIAVVVATSPLIALDRHFGFAGRLALMVFVAAGVTALVVYRASCSRKNYT